MQMQLGSDVQIRDGLLAENTLLSEKPRLGFERTETTVHQASIRLNYLNGNRVSSTVVFEGRPVSLMAQQQSGNPGQPTDAEGKPLPPPVPMPGAPDMPWVWQPDLGNDRRGTWGPGKGNWDHGANGNAPSASWEPGTNGKPGHWDVDNGRGRRNGGRSRYGADGTPIPDGQQHRMGLGSRLGALIHDHPIAAGAIIVGGAAIYVGAVIATGGAAAPAIAVAF
jgi:hypothetical protein